VDKSAVCMYLKSLYKCMDLIRITM